MRQQAHTARGIPDLDRQGRLLLAQAAPVVTVFLSSACILVIELAAGRLASRYLGQSLYTWTTIIGVVLAGISVGNYVGGRLADRSSSRLTLALQFFLAAAGCLSVLATNAWVGQWLLLSYLSWPVRIVVHLTLVFLLPAGLLGTISPVIAKRALDLGLAEGRTVGNVYAWATAGSILGTFFTGFYLLMWMGVTPIIATAAGGLALVGAVYAMGALLPQRVAIPRPRPVVAGSKTTESSRQAWLAPVLTIVIASVCVMIVEIVAGRMVSRHYGQSLYCWTTVIGGVLAGMTFGSYVGGRLADRFPVDKVLCALFLLASVSCQFIPLVSRGLVEQTLFIAWSWPSQIALQVVGAFVLPSILLGAITPVVVKAALARGLGSGRTVGTLYAWGSVGSIAGTFLAGFFLIEILGTVRLVHCVAAVLALTALAYGRTARTAFVWCVVCAVALFAAELPWSRAMDTARAIGLRDAPPDGAVYTDESQYSYIAVLADPNLPNVRQMSLDRLIHSRVDLLDPRDLRYEYEWIYSAVIDKYYPDAKPISALVIGGGGYAFPHYLEVTRPGSRIDVAEIDPAVTEAAHAACGLPRDTTVNIFNMDARNFIDDRLRQERAGLPATQYDCIFGDSINDYSVPYHLTTAEFNERLNELLADDGLYLLNLIDIFDSGKFLGAVVNTCKKTFPYVYVFSSYDDPTARDTFVVVCAKRPLDLGEIPQAIRSTHGYRGDLLTQDRMDTLAAGSRGVLLTDDFAPVDNMLAPVARTSRESYPIMLIESANQAIAEGRFTDAIDYAQMVLRSGVRMAEAHEVLGTARLKLGDVSGAIEDLKTSITENPRRETAYNNLGSALSQQGDFRGAIDAWDTAIAVNPAFIEAYKNLAFAHLSTNEPDKALNAAQTVVDSGTYLPEAHEIAGMALLRKGEVEGAIIALRRSIVADAKRPSAFNALGHALMKKGDVDGAIDAWKSAVAIKPDFAEGYQSIAAALAQKGDMPGVLANLKNAVEANPKLPAAHVAFGAALLKTGDVGGAVQELEAAVAIDPAFPVAQQFLAAAYWRAKEYDKAWDCVRKLQAAGKPIEPGFLESLKRDSGRTQ